MSDPALHYSPGAGRGWSFLWSLGACPFGPLSRAEGLDLPFGVRDAMLRNLALLSLNTSLGHAAALMQGFADLAGAGAHAQRFLMPEQVRWWERGGGGEGEGAAVDKGWCQACAWRAEEPSERCARGCTWPML